MRKMLLPLMLALLLLLAACQENSEPTPTPDLTSIGEVTIMASDGLPMGAEFFPGRGSGPRPSLLFLHMNGSDRRSWDELSLQLSFEGYNALVIDLRGHGETGGDVDWEQAQDDVRRAYEYLLQRPEVDPNRTAIVGASIGANLALVTAAAESQVRAVVALSPGLDYSGIKTEQAMSEIRGRPVLLIASTDDTYAADSAVALDAAGSPTELVTLTNTGHGTEMFSGAPDLLFFVAVWLSQVLG